LPPWSVELSIALVKNSSAASSKSTGTIECNKPDTDVDRSALTLARDTVSRRLGPYGKKQHGTNEIVGRRKYLSFLVILLRIVLDHEGMRVDNGPEMEKSMQVKDEDENEKQLLNCEIDQKHIHN